MTEVFVLTKMTEKWQKKNSRPKSLHLERPTSIHTFQTNSVLTRIIKDDNTVSTMSQNISKYSPDDDPVFKLSLSSVPTSVSYVSFLITKTYWAHFKMLNSSTGGQILKFLSVSVVMSFRVQWSIRVGRLGTVFGAHTWINYAIWYCIWALTGCRISMPRCE